MIPSLISAIGKNVPVLAVARTREVRVGRSFSRSAPGAAKLVEPVALSRVLASSLESTVDSATSKPRSLLGVVVYLSTIWN